MCNPTTANVNYAAEAEDITQLRNQAANARSGCCSCTFRKSGKFGPTGKLRQLRADGVTPNGQTDNPWTGELFVSSDGTRGEVTVYSRLKAINKTSDTTMYPDTVAVSDADLTAKVAKLPPAIERAWTGFGTALAASGLGFFAALVAGLVHCLRDASLSGGLKAFWTLGMLVFGAVLVPAYFWARILPSSPGGAP